MDKLRKELQDILLREPICRSPMMRYPMKDPAWDAKAILDLAGQPTPEGLTDFVRHEIEATCAALAEDEVQLQAYLAGLDRIWPVLEAKMQKSYSLAEQMRTIGCHSLFLPVYYAKLFYPASMLAPYGWAERLDGKLMAIPSSDPAYLLGGREPIFRTVLLRTAEQELVQLKLGDGANVMSLGAATLPEYVRFGWQERGIKQNVIAIDNAPGVMDFVHQIYPGDLRQYGVNYLTVDFWDELKDPAYRNAQDMVGVEGSLSYYMDRTDDLLRASASVLRPGGYFCGEVELKHLYTVRCGALGWVSDRPIQLDDGVESAIARIDASAKQAGLKMVEARPDEWNAQPAAVWFQLQKI